MFTLLFPIKCNPKIDPVSFFITMKHSAKILSPIPKLSVNVASGFFHLAISYLCLKIERVVEFENINWGLLFYCVQVILSDCTDVGTWVYQGIYC